MRIQRVSVCLLAAGLTVLAGPASAEKVSVAIRAQVATVDDPSSALGGAISVGDVLTGTYTYETSTPDSEDLPSVGYFRHSAPPSGISVSAGGLVFKTDPGNVDFLVTMVNDSGSPTGSDSYSLISYNNLASRIGMLVGLISWQLQDPTMAALSNADLPTAPPVLENWQSFSGLTISGGRSCYPTGEFFIRAHVTSAVSTVVALPGPVLEISPPSGTYVASQSADLAIILRPGVSITGATATLDGIDVIQALSQCVTVGTLVDGGQSFRCPSVRLGQAPLGPGDHTLVVTLNLTDGSSVNASALWKVLASSEP